MGGGAVSSLKKGGIGIQELRRGDGGSVVLGLGVGLDGQAGVLTPS